jgi:hypothetical protein
MCVLLKEAEMQLGGEAAARTIGMHGYADGQKPSG